MKKLLLFWLFSGSLDGMAQDKTDTLRAHLLITTGHMTIAHVYEGYVIKQGEKIIGYLDDRKKPFKSPVKIWGWMREEGGKR